MKKRIAGKTKKIVEKNKPEYSYMDKYAEFRKKMLEQMGIEKISEKKDK